MKKLKVSSVMFAVCMALSFYSCQEDPVSANKITPKKAMQPDNNSARLLSIICDVSGPSSVCAGQSANFIYTSDLPNPVSFAWTVVSGDITLTSGQGTNTATFSFGSGFNGGVINGGGSSGSENCSENFEISLAPAAPTPTITVDIIPKPGHPSRYEYTATYVSGATYNWYMNGVLQTAYTGNTYFTHIPCGITKTVKCSLNNSCGTSGDSNEIEETGECL